MVLARCTGFGNAKVVCLLKRWVKIGVLILKLALVDYLRSV